MADINSFFTEEQKNEIESAVKVAELNTSGEIRVHIESKCKEDVMDHAAFIFEKLEMHKTEQRNGVLFFMSVTDHKFAILGDGGINAKVPNNFWNEAKEHMIGQFKQGEISKGLAEGIKMAGEQLKHYFPYQSDDVNELSDEISFGK